MCFSFCYLDFLVFCLFWFYLLRRLVGWFLRTYSYSYQNIAHDTRLFCFVLKQTQGTGSSLNLYPFAIEVFCFLYFSNIKSLFNFILMQRIFTHIMTFPLCFKN